MGPAFERVRKPTRETRAIACSTDREFALISQAAAELGYPFGPYFQLLALTGQRREEVAGLSGANSIPSS